MFLNEVIESQRDDVHISDNTRISIFMMFAKE